MSTGAAALGAEGVGICLGGFQCGDGGVDLFVGCFSGQAKGFNQLFTFHGVDLLGVVSDVMGYRHPSGGKLRRALINGGGVGQRQVQQIERHTVGVVGEYGGEVAVFGWLAIGAFFDSSTRLGRPSHRAVQAIFPILKRARVDPACRWCRLAVLFGVEDLVFVVDGDIGAARSGQADDGLRGFGRQVPGAGAFSSPTRCVKGASRHQARLIVGDLHSESTGGDSGLGVKAVCSHAPMIGGGGG